MVQRRRDKRIFRPEIAEKYLFSRVQGPVAGGRGAEDRKAAQVRYFGNRGGRGTFGRERTARMSAELEKRISSKPAAGRMKGRDK